MAVAEDDDDAIYATFSYLNYKREQDKEVVRRVAPSPPTRPPLDVTNSGGAQTSGNQSEYMEFRLCILFENFFYSVKEYLYGAYRQCR